MACTDLFCPKIVCINSQYEEFDGGEEEEEEEEEEEIGVMVAVTFWAFLVVTVSDLVDLSAPADDV